MLVLISITCEQDSPPLCWLEHIQGNRTTVGHQSRTEFCLRLHAPLNLQMTKHLSGSQSQTPWSHKWRNKEVRTKMLGLVMYCLCGEEFIISIRKAVSHLYISHRHTPQKCFCFETGQQTLKDTWWLFFLSKEERRYFFQWQMVNL